MKTTSLIPPALLITGLLLSGCSGTDNPSKVVGQPKDFYGTYKFTANTNEDRCSNAEGTLTIEEDGKVEGDAVDPTGEPIKIAGSMDADGNGGISGSFDYPPQSVNHPAEFDGEHTTFTATPNVGQAPTCDFLLGKISMKNGFVTGDAIDKSTGDSIEIRGSVFSNGDISGQFWSLDDDGDIETQIGTYNGTILTSAAGDGTYFFQGCHGAWEAEKNSGTYFGTISAGADGSGDSGDGTWNDGTFDCPLGTWSAENITVTP